ncbi:pentapeptide repeat-containing protein [Nocardia takedensis]
MLLTRRTSERHFAQSHELERVKGLRERYTTCAEQLAHASPAVRQAGIYALTALADDWNTLAVGLRTTAGEPALHEEARICLDLLCAYFRSSIAEEDKEVRQSIVSVIWRHAHQWSAYCYDLRRADLTGADLSSANLSDANLSDANLTNAKLGGADVTGADLTGAKLGGANLRGVNLTGAELRNADLHGADLTGAELRNAKLHGADLTGADLTEANLRGVDLTGADLVGAYLTGANVTGAKLTGVGFDATTRWPEGFPPPPPSKGLDFVRGYRR